MQTCSAIYCGYHNKIHSSLTGVFVTSTCMHVLHPSVCISCVQQFQDGHDMIEDILLRNGSTRNVQIAIRQYHVGLPFHTVDMG